MRDDWPVVTPRVPLRGNIPDAASPNLYAALCDFATGLFSILPGSPIQVLTHNPRRCGFTVTLPLIGGQIASVSLRKAVSVTRVGAATGATPFYGSLQLIGPAVCSEWWVDVTGPVDVSVFHWFRKGG